MIPFVVRHAGTGTEMVVLGRSGVDGSAFLCASRLDGTINRIPEHKLMNRYVFVEEVVRGGC